MRRLAVLGVLLAAVLSALAPAAQAVAPTTEPLPRTPVAEAEPNDTPAGATHMTSGSRARGNVDPATDVDYYSFAASAGDRVYAAAMTDISSATTNSVLDLIGPDGSTVLQSTGVSQRATLSDVSIPANGTYYLRVSLSAPGATTPPPAAARVRPYDLYLQTRTGAPTPEVSGANGPTKPQALPSSGWASGDVSVPGDRDFFTLHLDPGDTVYASLHRDPGWQGRVDFGTPGAAGAIQEAPETVVATVNRAGTYYVSANRVRGGGGYRLSVTVLPAQQTGCRVYSSSGPVAVTPTDANRNLGTATSAISVPDDVPLGRAVVDLDFDYTVKSDLSIRLHTPADNDIQLLANAGSFDGGHESLRIDDAAATTRLGVHPPDGMAVTPDPRDGGRLGWTRGESGAGTWKLTVDDVRMEDAGTFSWRLVLCDDPPPAALPTTIYRSDFDSDDGGFAHSGTNDQWERGTPLYPPIDRCASGRGCWKTDLDGLLLSQTSQDLVSPPISLAGRTGPIRLTWNHRYQVEDSILGHYYVEVRRVGGGGARRLFDYSGPAMLARPEDACFTAAECGSFNDVWETAGWAPVTADLSDYAGQTIELRFHVDNQSTCCSRLVEGVAIDDVRVSTIGGDSDPPETTITSGPLAPTNNASPTFGFSSDEAGSTFECRVDDLPWAACTSPHRVPYAFPDGPHIFQVRATDPAGNTDPTPAARNFTVDTKAPVLELSGPTTQKLGDTVSVTVKAVSEDSYTAASGTVSIPGASQPMKLTGLSYRWILRGQQQTLLLKVPPDVRSAADAALRRGETVTGEIRVVAEDLGAGNRTVVKRAFTLTL